MTFTVTSRGATKPLITGSASGGAQLVPLAGMLQVDSTDDQAIEALVNNPASETALALSASFDHSGAVPAETQAGATPANKITAAAAAADNVDNNGVVIVPVSLSINDGEARASDLGVVSEVLIVDYRNDHGTISSAAQKGAQQLSRVFSTNLVSPIEANSDNGSVLALDAILTGGTGGNGESGSTVHGENCALYAGTKRTGGTRSGWGANVLIGTTVAPSATTQTIGLEVNVGNDSGAPATASTSLDGVYVLGTGNADLRFGLNVGIAAATPAVTWLDGIHIGGTSSRAAIYIEAPLGGAAGNASMLGIESLAPAKIATALDLTGTAAAPPVLRSSGPDDHIDLILDGKNDGRLDFRGTTGADPGTADIWFDAKVNGTHVRIPVRIVP